MYSTRNTHFSTCLCRSDAVFQSLGRGNGETGEDGEDGEVGITAEKLVKW